MSMLTELPNRGVADVCIVCWGWLKGGRPTRSPRYGRLLRPKRVSSTWCAIAWGMRPRPTGKITARLKAVYTAATVEAAERRFDEFACTWRAKL
jgi:putative transposase